jgi:hypothetical protein
MKGKGKKRKIQQWFNSLYQSLNLENKEIGCYGK